MMHACTCAHMRLEGGWVANVPPAGINCLHKQADDLQFQITTERSLTDVAVATANSVGTVLNLATD